MSDRPIRIVHCLRAPIGGLLRHVTDLAIAQSNAGHEVGLICDSSPGGILEVKRLELTRPYLKLGLRRFAIKRQISPTDAGAVVRMLSGLRSLRPDIVHGHGAKGGAYARVGGTIMRAFGPRAVRIYSPHGGSLHYDAMSSSGRAYFAAERILERMTDALVFVREFEVEAYRSKVGPPGRPVVVARNGLAAEDFGLVAPKPDAVDFLFLGRLQDIKGLDIFIEALASIANKCGRAPTALIIGDGPDKSRYQQMVRKRGIAETTLFHEPLPTRQAFALAHTLVVPSRAESLPYVVLEGIGAGIPVIATSAGGIPEIFGSASNSLIPPGDVRALTDAMIAKRNAPEAARTEALKLREQIRQKFSLEQMVATVEAAYRQATLRQ